jgi:hypothetical protein
MFSINNLSVQSNNPTPASMQGEEQLAVWEKIANRMRQVQNLFCLPFIL